MESTASRSGVDLAAERAHPVIAFVCALISLPGSTVAWDLPGGGFIFGFPFAIAAIVLGVQSRQRSQEHRGLALAAIVIGGLMLAQMTVWFIASAVS